MSLDSLVNVSITAETRMPTRTGFGIPLIMSYHDVFSPELYREYTSTTAMIDDGFASDDPAVLAAGKVFSQNPRPEKVIVGREVNREKQKMELWPVSTLLKPSYDYSVELNGELLTFTSDVSPTVAEICTGIAAALSPAAWANTHGYLVGEYVKNDTAPVKVYVCTQAGTSAGSGGPTGTGSSITDGTVKWAYVSALPSITVSDDTTHVTIESNTVADYFTLTASERQILQIKDVTPDGSPSGIVDDIVEVSKVNNDWYTLILTNKGQEVTEAAAAYIETVYKTFLVSSPDDDIYDAGTNTDVASVLQAAGYARTMLIYHPAAGSEFPDAAWAGRGLPYDPGSITWMYKNLSGVSYVDLTDTEIGVLKSKDCNMYIREAGQSFTQLGYTSAHEFFDITHGIDWLRARLQEAVFAVLLNSPKIPYTDKGVSVIQNAVQAVLKEAVNNQLLAASPAPLVTAPKVADISPIDRGNRLLPDVRFTGTLAGAIHKVEIVGVISV